MREKNKYVRMGGTYFRLRGDMYWCDGGEWGFSVRKGPKIYDAETFDTTEMYSVSNMSSINNKGVFPCSEKDWFNGNRNYIPIGYVFEDGTQWSGVFDDYGDDIELNDVFEDEDLIVTRTDDGKFTILKDDSKYMYLLIK